MDRIVLLLTVLMMHIITVKGQQKAEDSVKATVNNLFDGMRSSDATKVKAAFADSAILQTIIDKNKEGKTVVRTMSADGFATSVSKQAAGSLDERIRFETVKIDGALAIVWTPYKFYYNGQFSHCGVNSFQLVRMGGEWKIQYLIDTRRKDGCD